MASSEQLRSWYPEVVTNHAQRGTPGYWPTCDTSRAVKCAFPREAGGEYQLWVHPKTLEAWRAYAQAMRVFGETVPTAGGTHNCRNIANSTMPSLHAYCIALDLPPNSRKSAAFQLAVLAITTNSGARVFRNLESINDRMHDQIDCSPAALATGINWATVPSPPTDEDEMLSKQLTAETWGELYDQGIVTKADGTNPPEDRAAVVAYWLDPARPDTEHLHATNSIVRALARPGQHTHTAASSSHTHKIT